MKDKSKRERKRKEWWEYKIRVKEEKNVRQTDRQEWKQEKVTCFPFFHCD